MCIVSALAKLQSWLRSALPGDWGYAAKYTHEVPDSLSSHLGGGMRGLSQLGRHWQTGKEKKDQLEGPAVVIWRLLDFGPSPKTWKGTSTSDREEERVNFVWKLEDNPYGSEQLCTGTGLQGVWQRGVGKQRMLQLQWGSGFSFPWICHPNQCLLDLFLLRLALSSSE